MKKAFAFIFLIVFCFVSFCGCGGIRGGNSQGNSKDNSQDNPQDNSSGTSTSNESYSSQAETPEIQDGIQNPQAIITTEDGTIIYKMAKGIAKVSSDGSGFEILVDESLCPSYLIYHDGLIYFIGLKKATKKSGHSQSFVNGIPYDRIVFSIKTDGTQLTEIFTKIDGNLCIIKNYICFALYNESTSCKEFVRINTKDLNDIKRFPLKSVSNDIRSYNNYIFYLGDNSDEQWPWYSAIYRMDIITGEVEKIVTSEQDASLESLTFVFIDNGSKPYIYYTRIFYNSAGKAYADSVVFRIRFDGSGQETVKELKAFSERMILPLDNGNYMTYILNIPDNIIIYNSKHEVLLTSKTDDSITSICMAQDGCIYYISNTNSMLYRGTIKTEKVFWDRII